MIVVKIELWPLGYEGNKRELGRMYIANDGTGTQERGDYKVAVCRKGSPIIPSTWGFTNGAKPAREGVVLNYPRKAYNVWRLILRALKDCFPEENKSERDRDRVSDGLGDLEDSGPGGEGQLLDPDGGP